MMHSALNSSKEDLKVVQTGAGRGASYGMDLNGIVVMVTRKPIRNMYLRVKVVRGGMADIRALSSEPFYVEVSAPLRISDRTIQSFVEQRQDWIHVQEQRLKTSLNNRECGRLTGFEWTPERQARAQAHIQAQLPDLLEKCQSIVGRSPSHITLRIMTSRWGSCTPETGRIRLNLQLGLMDERFLEYVLIHELTHLWERGHGSGFQSRMDSYLPQWRKLRRELNQQMIW